MKKHIIVTEAEHSDLKKIAFDRGMTMVGLIRYVIKALREGRI